MDNKTDIEGDRDEIEDKAKRDDTMRGVQPSRNEFCSIHPVSVTFCLCKCMFYLTLLIPSIPFSFANLLTI